MAAEVQSPSAVPLTQSKTWSMAALAADAADDAPRTSMISAPRLATRGMNSSRSQRVVHLLGGDLAADLGVVEVRVLGGGVVAPDRHPLDRR